MKLKLRSHTFDWLKFGIQMLILKVIFDLPKFKRLITSCLMNKRDSIMIKTTSFILMTIKTKRRKAQIIHNHKMISIIEIKLFTSK